MQQILFVHVQKKKAPQWFSSCFFRHSRSPYAIDSMQKSESGTRSNWANRRGGEGGGVGCWEQSSNKWITLEFLFPTRLWLALNGGFPASIIATASTIRNKTQISFLSAILTVCTLLERTLTPCSWLCMQKTFLWRADRERWYTIASNSKVEQICCDLQFDFSDEELIGLALKKPLLKLMKLRCFYTCLIKPRDWL